MKIKKISSLLLATAMLVTVFSGCSKKESTSPDNAPATSGAEAEDTVTLTYWGWDSNWYQPLLDAYMEGHKNVKIEATDVAYSDLFPKVQQAVASGSELPTMIPMNSTLVESFKQLGIFEDLTKDPYHADPEEWVDYIVKRNTTSDGAMIGLAQNVTPSGIAYKRDLAKKYFGTDDPDELKAMFATYDDFAAKGSEVYEKSDGKDYLFHSGGAVAEWLYFADQTEVQENNTINFSEKMGFVIDTLVKFRDVKAVDTFQNGTPQGNATYADENHIFYPCPDWAVTYYIKANDPEGSGNWGIFEPGTGGYSAGGTSVGITKDATDAQKAAAYDFLVWAFTSEEGAKINYSEAGYITPYKKYCYDESFISNEDAFFGGQDTGKLFYSQILPNVQIPNTSVWDQTIVDIRDLLATAVMNDFNMTADDAIAEGLKECTNRITDESLTIK